MSACAKLQWVQTQHSVSQHVPGTVTFSPTFISRSTAKADTNISSLAQLTLRTPLAPVSVTNALRSTRFSRNPLPLAHNSALLVRHLFQCGPDLLGSL